MPLTNLRRHLECGEYVQARREAERLIQFGDLVGEDLVQAYRGAALAHYHVHEVFAAIKLGECALARARQMGNWRLIGKVRFDLGEFHLTGGDYQFAHDYLMQFLTDLELYPDLSGTRAWTHHKLGLLFRYRRDFASAVSAHRTAAELHRQSGDGAGALEAVRGMIWCYLTMGEPEKAWPLLDQLTTQVADRPNPHMTASLLTDLAYYYQQTGDLGTSTDYCAEVMAPGRSGVDDHILATACVIAGENAFMLDRWSEAQIFTKLAQEYALNAMQSALINRANALQRRLHENRTTTTPAS